MLRERQVEREPQAPQPRAALRKVACRGRAAQGQAAPPAGVLLVAPKVLGAEWA